MMANPLQPTTPLRSIVHVLPVVHPEKEKVKPGREVRRTSKGGEKGGPSLANAN